MFGITPLVPAYGRDYESQAAVKADFMADQDFVAANGQYINRSQLAELGLRRVEVRYAKLRKLVILNIS